jgi:tetratricopeptide (TPR) repeat protein
MPGLFLSSIQSDETDTFYQKQIKPKNFLWFLLLIPFLFLFFWHTTPAKLVDLPEKNRDFTGRSLELAAIEKQLFEKREGGRSPLLALYGESGVGKSELAIAFGNDHINDFSLIGWLDGSSEESLVHSYARLGDALDIHEEHPIRRREKIHQELENRQGKKPWLLIYDGLSALPFELPKVGGAILITCRDQSLFPSYVTLEVSKNPEDSLLMLSKLIGGTPTEELVHLAKQLDDLPLMINLAGYYIRATPGLNVADYSKMLDELIETEDSPLKWQRVNAKSLMASYRTTFALLQKKHPLSFDFLMQAALLHHRSIPNEFLAAWLRAKDSWTPSQITLLKGDILRELKNHSLIRYDEKMGAFSFHQLLSHALALHREGKADLDVWVQILSEDSLVTAYNPTHVESIRPFQRILPHVLKILNQITEPDQQSVQISLTVARYFIETEYRPQKGQIYLDLAQEWSKTFPHPIQGRIAFLKGMLKFREGEFQNNKSFYEEALGLFEKALKIFQIEDNNALYLSLEQNPSRCNKEYQRAGCKQFLGQTLRLLGRSDEAEMWLKIVMQDFQTITQGADHYDIARIMREQALLLWEKGFENEALNLLESAVQMQKRVYGDHYHTQPTVARTQQILGNFYLKKGDYLKAKQAYQLAIDIHHTFYKTEENSCLAELYRLRKEADQSF